MPDDSTRTVLVALGAGLGVALAKVGAAVFTGSTALAAEAAHSLADSGNDLSLFVAQRRSNRPSDDQHPLGYGREAYFWALIAAIGVFVTAAAFSLRGYRGADSSQRHLIVRRGLHRAGDLDCP
jgi:divalent metal cation (Fe/Co/Zn/Cd) transporter